MTKDEKNAGEIFAFISDATLIENYDCVTFAEQSLERRRLELIEGRLISTRFPTMCVKNLQTLLSKMGYAYSYRCKKISPSCLKLQLFLHAYRLFRGILDFLFFCSNSSTTFNILYHSQVQ